jgi:hypothetical protein
MGNAATLKMNHFWCILYKWLATIFFNFFVKKVLEKSFSTAHGFLEPKDVFRNFNFFFTKKWHLRPFQPNFKDEIRYFLTFTSKLWRFSISLARFLEKMSKNFHFWIFFVWVKATPGDQCSPLQVWGGGAGRATGWAWRLRRGHLSVEMLMDGMHLCSGHDQTLQNDLIRFFQMCVISLSVCLRQTFLT